MYKIQLYIENILGSIQNKKPVDVGEVSDGVASNWNPTEHDIMSNDWEIAG